METMETIHGNHKNLKIIYFDLLQFILTQAILLTYAKLSTHTTHTFFLALAKTLWTHATHAKISTHATHTKTLWNHATHTKILTHVTHTFFFCDPRQNFTDPRNPRIHTSMLPMPPTHPCCPCHLRYLVDSS